MPLFSPKTLFWLVVVTVLSAVRDPEAFRSYLGGLSTLALESYNSWSLMLPDLSHLQEGKHGGYAGIVLAICLLIGKAFYAYSAGKVMNPDLTNPVNQAPIASVLRLYSRPFDLEQERKGQKSQRETKLEVGPHGVQVPGMERRSDYDKDLFEHALLCQTGDSYEELRSHFPECASTLDASDSFFGENILLLNLNTDTVCIGDVWKVQTNGWHGMEFEVTCPAKPCEAIDRFHGASGGKHGIRHRSITTGTAGFFVKVRKNGSIGERNTIKCIRRPNPAWTVRRTAKALYGSCGANCEAAMKPGESRLDTLRQLREMSELQSLAERDWRSSAKSLLKDLQDMMEADPMKRII